MGMYESNIIEAIAKIEEQSFSSPWTKTEIEETFKYDYNHLIYIQDEDSTVIGYVIYNLIADESELLRIAVSSEKRKAGYGDKLMEEYLDKIRETAEKGFLEVRATNEAAISLYRKNRYNQIGIRKNYYNNPICDALIFEIELP